MTSSEDFARLLSSPEGARVEFKTAANRFDFDELVRYCVALANEGGGTIVLGVTDRRPRTVLGTRAFEEPGRTESGLYERLGHRVRIEEILHEEHRVLLVHVPARLPGAAWNDGGRYWMRAGDALVAMSDHQLRLIHAEVSPDFSAQACLGASLADLAPRAITEFRDRWSRRSAKPAMRRWSTETTLRNAELIEGGSPLNAALLLFGTRAALGRHIPQAEIVFEYRSSSAPGPAQDREEFREGFLSIHDALWQRIDLRNDLQSWQEGFFRTEVAAFDEAVIREAVLNAFCHRDYRSDRSVFVRQFAERIEIDSPGGFPPGITAANILDEQNPRNRRLAEALGKCGLVDRAGQGYDLMVTRLISQGKPVPDFSRTVAHEVRLTVRGLVSNPSFVEFLERVAAESPASFTAHDLMVLDLLQREEPVPESLRSRLPGLVRANVIETTGRGRGTRHILSRRLYEALGRPGAYTRVRGLDRDEKKALLLRHLRERRHVGARLDELAQVLSTLTTAQVQTLVRELKREGRIVVRGKTRAARWYPAPERNPTQ